MDSAKRKALEDAGWKFGDAADFLGMNEQERQLLDARVELALALRRLRESLHSPQKPLVAKPHSARPRVAMIDRATEDVSLDQLVRAFLAAGGEITVRVPKNPSSKKSAIKKRAKTVASQFGSGKPKKAVKTV